MVAAAPALARPASASHQRPPDSEPSPLASGPWQPRGWQRPTAAGPFPSRSSPGGGARGSWRRGPGPEAAATPPPAVRGAGTRLRGCSAPGSRQGATWPRETLPRTNPGLPRPEVLGRAGSRRRGQRPGAAATPPCGRKRRAPGSRRGSPGRTGLAPEMLSPNGPLEDKSFGEHSFLRYPRLRGPTDSGIHITAFVSVDWDQLLEYLPSRSVFLQEGYCSLRNVLSYMGVLWMQ
ncbi:PREDICTED: translation initiation factor IF-2-like [Rhinopithecus bieti]|uniref:translation initiation factor IF-2-like n=1 Tax=Rhinopithecus bieti TaxID=61621 RepID=UPI00083C83EF|nr:PREDICTED: translation initiation factor IF-2-like [Rhinopithecus bieti]